MNIKYKDNKAMTLVELVVAVIISSIILLGLMMFITNVFEQIAYSNSKIKLIEKVYDFQSKIKTLEGNDLKLGIVKNNETGTGSDVVLLDNQKIGYIIGMIDKENSKIDSDTNVGTIQDKVLGLKKLTLAELNNIKSNSGAVYDLNFYSDELYDEIKLKDLQAELFNSGSILNINLYINIGYKSDYYGKKFSEIPDLKIEKIVLNF